MVLVGFGGSQLAEFRGLLVRFCVKHASKQTMQSKLSEENHEVSPGYLSSFVIHSLILIVSSL